MSTRAAFLRQSHLAIPGNVLSATNEAGLTTQPPTPGTANLGKLRLRASGTPTTATTLDLALQRGGNVTGPSVPASGYPGAAVRYKASSAASDKWLGYTETTYLTYARSIAVGSATIDYPCVSQVRTLGNGSMGFLRTKQETGANLLQFLHKATVTGSWSVVSIGTDVDPTTNPALVVTPSGRLLAYYSQVTTEELVAWYSDDDGATWAEWSTEPIADSVPGSLWQAEYSEGMICLVRTYVPAGGGSVNSAVFWSGDGGQSFSQAHATTDLASGRTCVTRTGVVLLATTDRVVDDVNIHRILPGGGPGAAIDTACGTETLTPVASVATRDDGAIVLLAGSARYPVPYLVAQISLDHGLTWKALTGTTAAASTVVFYNGTAGGANRGYGSIGTGFWNGILIVIGVTDGPTAAINGGLHEMHFGGWDILTEKRRGGDEGYGGYDEVVYTPVALPAAMDWTKADIGAGATETITADGLNIVGTGADNSNWQPPAGTFDPAVSSHRLKIVYKVDTGTTLDDRAIVQMGVASGGTDEQMVKLRISNSQLELLDGPGNVLGTGSYLSGVDWITVFIAFEASVTSTTGLVSAWYKVPAGDWTVLASAAVVAEGAGTQGLFIGGLAAGVVDWTIAMVACAVGDNGLAAGFTNPADLAGRALDATTDFDVINGIKLGGASGGGVRGDTFTLATTAHYGKEWIWRSERPSATHRSTADEAAHTVVFYGNGSSFSADSVALFGTNFRTAALEMNATDSWGSPTLSCALDATLWSGGISTATGARGLGYFRVADPGWPAHKWRSSTGRRFFVEIVVGASPAVFEITDSDGDTIFVNGVDFSARTGTAHIFSDRMGGFFTRTNLPYARLSLASQVTADGDYCVGSLLLSQRHALTVPWANGNVDGIEANTALTETDTGYQSSIVMGPTREQMRIAFDPIDGGSSNELLRIRAFYKAVRGGHEAFAVWRDTNNRNDVELMRFARSLAIENVYGTSVDELARVGELILRPVF